MQLKGIDFNNLNIRFYSAIFQHFCQGNHANYFVLPYNHGKTKNTRLSVKIITYN